MTNLTDFIYCKTTNIEYELEKQVDYSKVKIRLLFNNTVRFFYLPIPESLL